MPSKPLIIPVVEYTPDLPDYHSDGSATVLNVIPRTPKSYGPMSGPAVFSNALTNGRCQGSFFGLDPTGNVVGFAGDAKDLYELTASSSNWSVVSKAAGGYSCPLDEMWHFAIFGQRVIATDFGDNIQSFLLGVDTKFSDLSATAPKARYCAAVKSWMMVANTSDPTNGNQPQRVWWSANGDPTNWPTPGTANAAQFQSDYQDLYGDGGWIQGLIGNLGTADAAVFMEHAIWRIVYSGGAGIFDFFPAEGVRGTPAPGSIAQNGAVVYYLGEDGFYVFDGSNSLPIGANKVDKTFYSELDQSYYSRISSTIDPINKLYIISYPTNGSAGVCDTLLLYNWQLNRWSKAKVNLETIVRTLSFGYTLDELYTILGYNIDGLPFGLDSRAWTGGTIQLGGFDTNHRLNFFTGGTLQGTVDTSEIQPFDGQLARIINARAAINGGTPTVAIGTRNRQVDSVTYGAAIPINSIGTSPQRAVGRYIRAELVMPAGQTWTHCSGVELEATQAGYR